ncbi:MarC family protein [Actinomyces howellii]|uniref:UPF0056 membrane protein n=1 Tax=Actinomyces howellii TaxID=52771 RepID=A0A3S4R2X9_9ACTO|nr:MarC family protein [Actinomyces howellii]VEG27491.1 membrane protein, MarC family [Actinomyces howellii]
MDTALLIKALGAFFAIMNPFVNLPLFLSLTAAQDASRQRRTAWRTLLLCTLMCAVVAVAGSALLSFFGISINDFRVAGGLVLLLIALGMLSGQGSSAHEGTPAEKDHASAHAAVSDVAFYPMTFPIIVGPGTMTTIIVMFAQDRSASGVATVALALAMTLVLLGVVLLCAGTIGRHMSMTLRTIMTRLMGMILAAIAVGMLSTGLAALFPGLAR